MHLQSLEVWEWIYCTQVAEWSYHQFPFDLLNHIVKFVKFYEEHFIRTPFFNGAVGFKSSGGWLGYSREVIMKPGKKTVLEATYYQHDAKSGVARGSVCLFFCSKGMSFHSMKMGFSLTKQVCPKEPRLWRLIFTLGLGLDMFNPILGMDLDTWES